MFMVRCDHCGAMADTKLTLACDPKPPSDWFVRAIFTDGNAVIIHACSKECAKELGMG